MAEKTRKEVGNLADLEKFEKSKVGQDVLSFFEAENATEILENERKLFSVVSTLGGEPDQVDREGALAFLAIVARKCPDFIRASICDPGFDGMLHDRLVAEMGWDPAEFPAVEVEPFVPQKRAESPKSQGMMGDAEKTALVEGLEKAEVFKTVFRLCETDSLEEIMADPEKLDMALLTLGADHNHVDPRQFGAFVLKVAEGAPKLVFEFFLGKPMAEMVDPDCKEALVRLLRGRGFPATARIFESVELAEGVDPYEVKKTFLGNG